MEKEEWFIPFHSLVESVDNNVFVNNDREIIDPVDPRMRRSLQAKLYCMCLQIGFLLDEDEENMKEFLRRVSVEVDEEDLVYSTQLRKFKMLVSTRHLQIWICNSVLALNCELWPQYMEIMSLLLAYEPDVGDVRGHPIASSEHELRILKGMVLLYFRYYINKHR
jgi:hypothetical protein